MCYTQCARQGKMDAGSADAVLYVTSHQRTSLTAGSTERSQIDA